MRDVPSINMSFNSTNQARTTGSANVSDVTTIMWHVQVIFLSFTILAAFLGNVLVLAATYLDKSLHNANKLFVASLAAADLFVAMFSVTIRLHQYIQAPTPLTITPCRFWIWADTFSEAASITTVMVISIDRYYKVCKPLQYRAKMTMHQARRIILLVWIYAGILGALGLVPYGSNEGVQITQTGACINDNKTFYTLAALLGFFLPVVMLIIFCTLIFRIVQTHNKKRLTGRLNNTIHEGSRTRPKKRGLVTLFLIVVTFIVCWGPFFILFVIYQYNHQLIVNSMGKQNYEILNGICFGLLPYANSFLNPVIYGYFDEKFNAAILNIIRKPCQRSSRHFTTITTKSTVLHRRSTQM